MVAVKQLIIIMLVYIVSFAPTVFALNVTWISFWVVYLLYINNVANFFIYLAVNTEFRNEAKNMINVIVKKLRRRSGQEIFVLR